MTTTKKTYLNWSSGKDALIALHIVHKAGGYDIQKLVTTINDDLQRVSMHGVSVNLLQAQANALQLPLHMIALRGSVSLSVYNETMNEHMQKLIKEGFGYAIFGDILLEDLKTYREKELSKVGLQAVFPLWKKDTLSLAREFIDLGYKAIVVCTSAKNLDASFCGREFNHKFLKDLPHDVDPCGENGEFHTFVYDGPLFKHPISFKKGEKVMRSYEPSNKNADDDCFKGQTFWDNQFWFQELEEPNSPEKA
ncbi:diphthine--ammonia ligase [Mesonia ostreae]|uniref:Diphthine--ammonia ligase n=1 Tax=Mesonia ostreae TaxID=861110 RepID=A0ABU2KGP8_9FLAO|nr:diphthine--ammonia ligase [Mesonia ostreae]MDT0293844.1 diphthine--ammonia ligase [Mesonia ostreae]